MAGMSKCGHSWNLNDRISKIESLREHIENNVIKSGETECWKWNSTICPRMRWGIFNCRGNRYRAQSAVYEVYCGDIIHGTCIMNSCSERTCCNPEHLFIGTYSDYRVQYMQRVTGSKSWTLDPESIGTIKNMVDNGKDIAYIALYMNVPVGVIRRIKQRGKNIDKEDEDAS